MAERRNEETDRFEAISETGKAYTIVVTQEIIVHRSNKGWFFRIPVSISLKTSEGDQVIDKGSDMFEILPSGILVKMISG